MEKKPGVDRDHLIAVVILFAFMLETELFSMMLGFFRVCNIYGIMASS